MDLCFTRSKYWQQRVKSSRVVEDYFRWFHNITVAHAWRRGSQFHGAVAHSRFWKAKFCRWGLRDGQVMWVSIYRSNALQDHPVMVYLRLLNSNQTPSSITWKSSGLLKTLDANVQKVFHLDTGVLIQIRFFPHHRTMYSIPKSH